MFNFIFELLKKLDAFLLEGLRSERCESTSKAFYFQKLASIQPRTSLLKFGGDSIHCFNSLLSHTPVAVTGRHAERRVAEVVAGVHIGAGLDEGPGANHAAVLRRGPERRCAERAPLVYLGCLFLTEVQDSRGRGVNFQPGCLPPLPALPLKSVKIIHCYRLLFIRVLTP